MRGIVEKYDNRTLKSTRLYSKITLSNNKNDDSLLLWLIAIGINNSTTSLQLRFAICVVVVVVARKWRQLPNIY